MFKRLQAVKIAGLAAGAILMLTGAVIGPVLAFLGSTDDLLLDVIAVSMAGAGLFIILAITKEA